MVKGTLHFRNILGSNESLDPPEEHASIENTKYNLENPQNLLQKIWKDQFWAYWEGFSDSMLNIFYFLVFFEIFAVNIFCEREVGYQFLIQTTFSKPCITFGFGIYVNEIA